MGTVRVAKVLPPPIPIRILFETMSVSRVNMEIYLSILLQLDYTPLSTVVHRSGI